jgi:hypothetical protein
MIQWFVLHLITLIGWVRGGWVGFCDGMRLCSSSLSHKGEIASPSTIRIYVVRLLALARSRVVDQRVCPPKRNTSNYLLHSLFVEWFMTSLIDVDRFTIKNEIEWSYFWMWHRDLIFLESSWRKWDYDEIKAHRKRSHDRNFENFMMWFRKKRISR